MPPTLDKQSVSFTFQDVKDSGQLFLSAIIVILISTAVFLPQPSFHPQNLLFLLVHVCVRARASVCVITKCSQTDADIKSRRQEPQRPVYVKTIWRAPARGVLHTQPPVGTPEVDR